MRISPILTTAVAAAVGVAAAAIVALWSPAAQAQLPEFDVDARYHIPLDDAPARGPADALVTIVEFSDFACQYCRRAQRELAFLERLYPRDIRVVFRLHPLDLEEGTLPSEASLAAHEQGLFWPMHDRIFAAGGIVSRAQVESFGVEIGLDMGRFRETLDSGALRQKLVQQAVANRQIGVFSTPRFFINGRPIKGSQSLRVFVDVVTQELTRARALTASGVPASAVYETLMKTARPRADSPAELSKNDPRELDEDRVYQVWPGLAGHSMGPDDALVTVVVFTDFQCPFCRKALPSLSAIRAAYPDDVRIAFRHLPLEFHPDAQLASEAAVEAAHQGRFWEMHDVIFAHQKALKRADLERYAQQLGLDMAGFRRALDLRVHLDAVKNDRAYGAALGVRATPTMFINGTPLTGARSFEHLDVLYLEPKLEEARALIAAGTPRAEVYATLMKGAEPISSAGAAAESPASAAGAAEEAGSAADYRELLLACGARDAVLARTIFARLGEPGMRAEARARCRPYGVDLVE